MDTSLLKPLKLEKEIKCHNNTAYYHESNGRVELLIGTITEETNKIYQSGDLSIRLKKGLEVYNSVKHSALSISPNEACKPENWSELKDKYLRKEFRITQRDSNRKEFRI